MEAAQAAKLAAERAKQVLGPIKVDLATPELGEITNQLPTIMINQNGKPVPLPQFSPPMTITVFYRPPPKLVPHTISKTTSTTKKLLTPVLQQMACTQY